MELSQTMISVEALLPLVQRREVKMLDASWYLPAEARNPYEEFLAARIPGSRFFDIEAIADQSHACPHMLPSVEQFAQQMEALGVASEDQVVIYDGKGLFSAPRAWWMFRVFGHSRVRILSGGLPAWLSAGFETESGDEFASVAPVRFRAEYQREWVANKQRVQSAVDIGGALIFVARSPARFAGEEEEPRPGVRPGHIPDSRNLHYASVLEAGGLNLKAQAELQTLTADVGVDQADAVITTCGSGISACLLALALHEIGYSPVAVYDGSWAEWGSDPSCSVQRG